MKVVIAFICGGYHKWGRDIVLHWLRSYQALSFILAWTDEYETNCNQSMKNFRTIPEEVLKPKAAETNGYTANIEDSSTEERKPNVLDLLTPRVIFLR